MTVEAPAPAAHLGEDEDLVAPGTQLLQQLVQQLQLAALPQQFFWLGEDYLAAVRGRGGGVRGPVGGGMG